MHQSEYMKLWRQNNAQKIKEYNTKAVTDYSEGKIYRIVCNVTNEQYIGSTKEKYLSRRLQRHKHHYKEYLKTGKRYMTSFPIIKREDFEIILLEKYPCDSKLDLEKRERYYIENNDCVNKKVPTRTAKEERKAEPEKYKEIDKKWNTKKKEKQKEKYKCECGSTLIKHHKARHERSQKHIDYIDKSNEKKLMQQTKYCKNLYLFFEYKFIILIT